jgi:hypothetical protein
MSRVPWPAEQVPCFRCGLVLSTAVGETQWHWDNFNVSWKWSYWENGAPTRGLVRCIRCMNVENGIPVRGVVRAPTREYRLSRFTQGGALPPSGLPTQTAGRFFEELHNGVVGMDSMPQALRRAKGKGKGKGKGEGKGQGKPRRKGEEGYHAHLLDAARAVSSLPTIEQSEQYQ